MSSHSGLQQKNHKQALHCPIQQTNTSTTRNQHPVIFTGMMPGDHWALLQGSNSSVWLSVWTVPLKSSALCSRGGEAAMVESVTNVSLSWTVLQLWSCCCWPLHRSWILKFIAGETLFGFPCLWPLWCSCHHRSCCWDNTSSLTIWKNFTERGSTFLPFVDPTAYMSLFFLQS